MNFLQTSILGFLTCVLVVCMNVPLDEPVRYDNDDFVIHLDSDMFAANFESVPDPVLEPRPADDEIDAGISIDDLEDKTEDLANTVSRVESNFPPSGGTEDRFERLERMIAELDGRLKVIEDSRLSMNGMGGSPTLSSGVVASSGVSTNSFEGSLLSSGTCNCVNCDCTGSLSFTPTLSSPTYLQTSWSQPTVSYSQPLMVSSTPRYVSSGWGTTSTPLLSSSCGLSRPVRSSPQTTQWTRSVPVTTEVPVSSQTTTSFTIDGQPASEQQVRALMASSNGTMSYPRDRLNRRPALRSATVRSGPVRNLLFGNPQQRASNALDCMN